MPYLPPEVVGLLLALAVGCGVVLMLGMRISMRRELEPLSRRARWFLLGSLAAIGLGGYALYHLSRLALHV